MSFIDLKVAGKSEHQKIWDLLPWYVNRTLEAAEQDIVKEHLKTCITCRIELSQQQRIFEKIQQSDLLQQVSQVSLAQLKKRINDQGKSNTSMVLSRSGKELRSSSQWIGFVKYTALAASLLIMATPFMLISTIDQSELRGEYRTLANPSAGESLHNRIRIVFANQPDPEQIESILNNVSGHIINGPSQNGVYEVQIGYGQPDLQNISDAIARLRKNPRVVFAEPAY